MIELFRPPDYEKVKVELPGELLDELDQFVEYVKTLGEWEADNAVRDNVLEYIVQAHLSSNRSESVNFRRWRANEGSNSDEE